MREHVSDDQDYEVLTDERTVWVNGQDGMCIGRFTKHGMDVHADGQGQLNGAHCLDCASHDKSNITQSWGRFVTSMKTFHDVDIPAGFKPSFVA